MVDISIALLVLRMTVSHKIRFDVQEEVFDDRIMLLQGHENSLRNQIGQIFLGVSHCCTMVAIT